MDNQQGQHMELYSMLCGSLDGMGVYLEKNKINYRWVFKLQNK